MITDVRERIERYIKNTKLSPKIINTYCMYNDDMCMFYEELNRDWFRAMSLVFAYGQAKGYRAAKAEVRKEKCV